MPSRRVEELLPKLEEAIREKYPQHAEIHTVGIGGWLTFLACCRHQASYFKQPLGHRAPDEAVPSSSRDNGGEIRRRGRAHATFEFDVCAIESIAKGREGIQVGTARHCVILSEDGEKIHVLPAELETDVGKIYKNEVVRRKRRSRALADGAVD